MSQESDRHYFDLSDSESMEINEINSSEMCASENTQQASDEMY